MPFNLQDLFPQGIDIMQLLNQQQGYTQGMAGAGGAAAPSAYQGITPGGPSAYEGVATGPVAMNAQFDPALSQMLQTGAPVDVSGAAGAAGSEARRMFRELSGGISERMAAMGKTGSSAQTGQELRGATDVSTMLGEFLGRLKTGALESAAGRRMGAMQTALGQGQLGLGARGLDLRRAGGLDAYSLGQGQQALQQAGGMDRYALGQGQLGLAGRQAQAGAGMDMLGLLRSFAGIGGRAGGGGRAAPQGAVSGGRPTAVRPSYGGGMPVTRPSGLQRNPMLMMQMAQAARKRGGGKTGFGMSDTEFMLSRPDLMQQYGILSGQGDVARGYGEFGQTQADALGKLMGGSASQASAIMPLLMQLLQGRRQSQVAQTYGPGYAYGGA